MRMNQFGDMSALEFKKRLRASRADLGAFSDNYELPFPYENSPIQDSSIDWRDEGVVTTVKDQQLCNK